jgi:ABC-type transporter Mla subunit MlaD
MKNGIVTGEPGPLPRPRTRAIRISGLFAGEIEMSRDNTDRQTLMKSLADKIDGMTELIAEANRLIDERSDYLRDVGGPLRTAIAKLKNALDELDKKT